MLSGFDFSSYDTLDAATLQAQALTSGIYFAYLRASHGLTQDASFASARSDCDSSVVLNGAYHFVMPNEDLDQQTAVFAGQVGVVRPGNLPPCLDFEWTEKKDGAGNITIPEYWQPIAPADRITLILNILRKVETALRVVPAVYTNTNFWHDYIVQPNPNADLSGFARYPLWLVDLAGDAKLPKPWAKAHFVQNHFGENAAPGAPWFETLDQDFFNGSAAELFALIRPGFVLSASSNPPCSAIVCDCQAALNAQGINVGTADGLFGATTKAGVQQYQKTKGLSQTGNLDVWTLQMLLSSDIKIEPIAS